MADTTTTERVDLGGRTLRGHTAHGTLVNAAFLVGLDSLGFVKGFIVAGFLTTGDYGVWGILVVALGTLLLLKQVGIADKYIQQDEPDQRLAFQKAFTLELVLSAAFAVLLIALLPLVALVYGEHKLIAPGLALILLIPAGVLQTPTWVFYRRMQFVRQRTLQAIDPLVAFVVTVALAVAGAGYWALVWGAVAGAWAGAIAAVLASPFPLRLRWDRGTLREYAGFSWPLLITGASGMIIAQTSILVGEHELGLAGAGAITLASTIAIYADRVDGVVTATLYPAICAVRDRTELLFETFVKSNRMALMWGVPFGVGVALFADDLVSYAIGERWRAAVGLIEAFGLMAAANHLGFNWSAFYRARGETRPLAVVTSLTMVVFVAVAIPLLAAHGLDGLAIGMGITTAAALGLRTVYLVRLFPGFQMTRHAVRAIAPTVPAAVAVLAVRWIPGVHRSAGLAVAELALYLAVTVAATLALERPLLREIAGYLRGGRATGQPRVAT
jgi:O-antigen/teichoic acid export membrane protein